MKQIIAVALAVNCLSVAWADSLFKDPILVISPRSIDFGTVPLKTTVTNNFLVENWGGGKLVGKATVPRPFKIISGASYKLGRADAQIITVIYSPSGALVDTNVVKFTGGSGALAPVTGKPGIDPADRPR
jgi:hypothetical protein